MSEVSPSVSIVIASFNSAEFLPGTISSALSLNLPAREIIVVDDGSTDNTPEICTRFGKAIRYVPIKNGGVSAARNHGATLAGGDWLLFLDSDDLLLPAATASLLAEAEKKRAGFAYGMVLERRPPPEPPRHNGFDYCAGDPPHPAQANFIRSAIITPGSAIVRRRLHERIGGFTSGFEPMEDRDYWIKCGLLESAAHCPEVVLDKTWRPGSHGSQHAKRIYRGMLSKMALRAWCAKREVDYTWAGSDRDFVVAALKEALYWRTHDILPALLVQARRHSATGFWYWRTKLRLLGCHPQPPAWIPN